MRPSKSRAVPLLSWSRRTSLDLKHLRLFLSSPTRRLWDRHRWRSSIRLKNASKTLNCRFYSWECEGQGGSAVRELRQLVKTTNLPVVETFQGAGVISRELENNFLGRVGLFKNQPGDVLINKADLIISVGYDSVEYDPHGWNFNGQHDIIHIDSIQADIDTHYRPT
ncbi:hypothetical protein [Corynebacterium kroppenstedtii]|uniref:hypothetical protein n=1 Tax=Corynebacterium kroppenstedtii TaxID=161879 RepID=UPI0034CED720